MPKKFLKKVVDNSNEVICKNCETKFSGHFCPNCGQSVRDMDMPFKVLVLDVMANMWAFDTRVLKTLKSLIFKPGEIAADYVEGKRERYMPPFRIYVFISIILFLLLNIATNRELDKTQTTFTANEIDEAKSAVNIKVVDDEKGTAQNTLKSRDFIKKILDNKDYYISRFFSILSWSLFLLMPFYAFLLWVLFRKQQKYYLAHFIFAINQHTFLFLIFVILLGINLIFSTKTVNPEFLLLLLFPVYFVKGNRQLYKTRWSAAIFKGFLAQTIYLLVIVIAIAFMLYATFYKTFQNV